MERGGDFCFCNVALIKFADTLIPNPPTFFTLVAVGSCTQIALVVVPLTVLVGWIMDKPMTLNFPYFEITLYVLSVFTVSIVISYPKVNWLEGSLLITTYLLIAVGFWYEKVIDFR